MKHEIAFSSARQDWQTPKALFDALNDEFDFTLDAAASDQNALCDCYYTVEDDALSQSFYGDSTFLNPPYGSSIGKWVRKAYDESQLGATVVMLIPARTETRWWHGYVMKAAEIRFIKGRLRFSGCQINAPFPSAVVVFKRGDHVPVISAMDRLNDEATP